MFETDEWEDSAQNKVSKSPTPGTETTLMRSRTVTPQAKVKVQNISRMFRSENPFCRIMLRASYTHEGSSLVSPNFMCLCDLLVPLLKDLMFFMM